VSAFELRRLIPDAPRAVLALLDGNRGPLQPPIRSELFGQQRFAQHGRSLGATHRAARAAARDANFFPRLRNNIRTLREAHRYIGEQAQTGYDISPAAEWLLDNFHLIEAQLKQIHDGLPRSYFRALPMLLDEPLAGLPRIYGVAWAFVAHTDGAFDEELLVRFLCAYQETRELDLSEMWALPTTLRVVLIENLRRLAERVACNKAARAVANLCADRMQTFGVPALEALRAQLAPRGVGPVFLAQLAQRLQDRPAAADPDDVAAVQQWLQQHLPDGAAQQAQRVADQAADNLSVSNAVTSLRAIGDADWSDIVGRTSALMQLMLGSQVFESEHAVTRDQSLHGIERLARRSGRSEREVAQALLERTHAHADTDKAAAAGYWLSGPGRDDLRAALGLRRRWPAWWRTASQPLRVGAYLGALGLASIGGGPGCSGVRPPTAASPG
jgi:cyclic beta-1,2-glucan synthetase